MWRPTAELASLQERARILELTRDFFKKRGVLEVETPVLSRFGSTEIHLDQYQTQSVNSESYYLNTSAELAMKRLLAAGYGDIYQISKVFRANELGSRHEPEFTMLEWYRTGFNMQQLMDEVADYISSLAKNRLSEPPVQLTYQQAFNQYLAIDPFTATEQDLIDCFVQHKNYQPPLLHERQACLDLLMSELIEPEFPKEGITFITHYPAEQASLAKLDKTNPRVAERFEVFAGGMELGNGFHELTDFAEQQQRMLSENNQRRQSGKTEIRPDAFYCAALESGLPDCSGIAIGFDRLVMLIAGKKSIQEVKTFSSHNA